MKVRPSKRRVNPSGKVTWRSRYDDDEGRERTAGTFKRKHEADEASKAACEAAAKIPRGGSVTAGEYAARWPRLHPRSSRTNTTNESRLRSVLDLELEGLALRHWALVELRRRHAVELVDQLLRVQGRAYTGAQNVLRTLSAMCEDAISDELADLNFVSGVRVRETDPRAVGATRPPRLFSFEQMHAFAAYGGAFEPMLRVFGDCGLRLGEVLGLDRRDFDGEAFHTRGAAHSGRFTEGNQPTKKHVRTVPCPPSTADKIAAMPRRIDTPLLFPTAQGRIWHESNFRRDVWIPTVAAYRGIARRAGENQRDFRARVRVELKDNPAAIRPHDCRHSWVTHLRAARIDDADLAEMAGHSVDTMLATYTHALKRSHEQVRQVIG
jgi:integrase